MGIGITLFAGQDEEIPIDTWQNNYRIRKARDRGGIPVSKGVMDDKERDGEGVHE